MNFQLSSTNVLLACNFILSIGAIIGASIWAAFPNDMYLNYTFSATYGFYWFVSVFSFVIGIIGVLYHGNVVKFNETSNRLQISFVLMIKLFITITIVIFWLAASASVATVLRECQNVKQEFAFWGYDSVLQLHCNGPIVTTVFGFSEFITWCVVLYFVAKYTIAEYNCSKNEQPTVALEPISASHQETV